MSNTDAIFSQIFLIHVQLALGLQNPQIYTVICICTYSDADVSKTVVLSRTHSRQWDVGNAHSPQSNGSAPLPSSALLSTLRPDFLSPVC